MTPFPASNDGVPWAAHLRVATLIGFLSVNAADASEIEGLVTDVQDGDSITLAKLSESYRVRLLDIDAPELKQPFGIESRASLREVCLFKRATVETRGDDRYGRTLATVRCAGVDAGAEQVRRGMAWVFVRYAPKSSPLYALEKEARESRRGLWNDKDPLEPWNWRQLMRKQ